MGADTFLTRSRGRNVAEAFHAAVERARYEDGHAGYTGTIAEKSSWTVIQPAAGESPEDCANRLLDDDDRRIADKWGPAGAIKVGDGDWLFFGWASS